MRLVKTLLSTFLVVAILIGLFQLIPFDSYKSNPEIVGSNYATLHKNLSDSGYVASEEEVKEAFYSYMHKTCSPEHFNESSASTECYKKLKDNFESCFKTSMKYINLADLNQNNLHHHFRSFKVCVE